jgi:two-component system, response regulator YesN
MSSSINPLMIKQFFLERIKNQSEFYLHPPFFLEQKVLSAISERNIEKATLYLDEINQIERPTLAETPLRSLKNSYICLCTLFTRAIIQGGMPPELAFNLSDVYINQIEKSDDMKQLAELEYQMLHHFVTALNEEVKQTYKHTIQQAITYIHEHIIDDLSLEIIAEHVFVNPNYLSQIFKKEVGMCLTTFINKKRVEDSKYFLLHTNTPISNIAILFRFCNQSYYTATFKRYIGLTPKEFRRINKFSVSS